MKSRFSRSFILVLPPACCRPVGSHRPWSNVRSGRLLRREAARVARQPPSSRSRSSSTSRLTTPRGTRPCCTSITARTSAAPLPAKHWSVQQSACGERMTLSSFRIGSSGSGGSCSSTSSPAPAMRRSCSARVSAFWSTIGPRDGVDEIGRRLHQREPLGVDDVVGLRRQRAADRQHVGAAEDLLQPDQLDAELRRDGLVGEGVVGDEASCRAASRGGRPRRRCCRCRATRGCGRRGRRPCGPSAGRSPGRPRGSARP